MAFAITSPATANISDNQTSLSVSWSGASIGTNWYVTLYLRINGITVASWQGVATATGTQTLAVSANVQALYNAAKGSSRTGAVSVYAENWVDGIPYTINSASKTGGTLTINYRISDLNLSEPLNSNIWNMDNIAGNLLSSSWSRTNSAFFARLKGYVNDVLVFNRYGFGTNSGTDVISLGYKDAIIAAMSGVSPASFRLDIVTQFDDGTADYEDLSYTASEVSGNYTRRSIGSTSSVTNSFYTLSTIAINNCTLSDATNTIPYTLTAFGSYAHTVKLFLRVGLLDTLIRTENLVAGVTSGNFSIGTTERSLILNAMPSTTTATIWAEVTTASYGSTNSQNVANTLTLDVSYKPTIGSVTWAEAMAYVKTALGYTTGTPFFLTAKSKIAFTVPVTNAIGATTAYIRVQFAGTDTSQASSPLTTDFLINSGSLAAMIIVTDSRGRSSTLTTALIVVRAYSYPIVSKFEVYRAISASGAYDPLGTFLRSIVQGSAFSVKALDGTTEKNWVKYKIDYRIKATGPFSNNTAFVSGGLTFGELTTSGVSSFLTINVYDVRIRVFDAFYDLDGNASTLEDTDDYAEGITILPYGEVSMMLGKKKMSVGKVHSGVGTVDLAEDSSGISVNADGIIQTNKQLKSSITSGTPPIVVTSPTKVQILNVEQVDGYDAGNASGNIPVSNGTLNTNLNADMLDGLQGVDLQDIVSYGSSGTNWWTKYKDGTLIKHGYFSVALNCGTARGGLYQTPDQTSTYDTTVPFTTRPVVTMSANNPSGYYSWFCLLTYSTTQWKWALFQPFALNTTFEVHYHAIGRWN
jgi:hypothetical protein